MRLFFPPPSRSQQLATEDPKWFNGLNHLQHDCILARYSFCLIIHAAINFYLKKMLRNILSLSSDLSCAQNKMGFRELEGPRVGGGDGECKGEPVLIQAENTVNSNVHYSV